MTRIDTQLVKSVGNIRTGKVIDTKEFDRHSTWSMH